MGDNHRAAGFDSVRAFVLAMASAETAHLDAFTRFVAGHKKMLAALRKKEWAVFAAAYNGSGYKKNEYDEKIAAAYKRFAPKAAAALPGKP